MHSGEFIARNLQEALVRRAHTYPVVTVTGPRQSGKTTLCRQTFPDKPWVSLEELDNRDHAQEDPRSFLAQYADGAIFDEIQRVPDLLSYLQGEVDARPEPGRFILTGSENLTLSEKVNQSLAGRTAVLNLLPPSLDELQRFENAPQDLWKTIWSGAYPRIYHRGVPPHRWLDDYIRTYVERDVRQVLRVTNLATFRRFLALAAGRTAQEIRYTDLGADAGVSHTTARDWLSILETTFVVFTLPAWHRNVRKQQVRTPKLHFVDTGLLCALLGIENSEQLRHHSQRGSIFETWVATEVLKARMHRGLRPQMFHYRENRGVEIDLVVGRQRDIALVEAKSGQTVASDWFKPLRKLGDLLADQGEWQIPELMVLYGGHQAQRRSGALALPWHRIHHVNWGTDDSLDELDDDERDDQGDDDDDETRAMQRIADAVIPHFQPGGRFHDRYDPPEPDGFSRPAAASLAWQAVIFPKEVASGRLLRIYPIDDQAEELSRAHWQNEARALHRIASSKHPTLPELHEVGRLRAGQDASYGYLILDDTGDELLPGHPLLSTFHERRDEAFRHFFNLVEAVALLHDEGLVHRNLTPLATRAPRVPDALPFLDGFQMSAFAVQWLRRGVSGPSSSELTGEEPIVSACRAPERLRGLLHERAEPESLASDVFGLGMLGLAWLAIPFEDWPAYDTFTKSKYDDEAHHEFLDCLDDELMTSGLYLPLRELLQRMLAIDPVVRPANARVVYDELCAMYGRVLAQLDMDDADDARALHVYYLQESVQRLYDDAVASTSPDKPDYREYGDIIRRDLDGGVLTWSPHGGVPWSRERDPERLDKMKSARTALIGERYVYFCEYLHHGRQDEDRRVLVIKFMFEGHCARDLRRQERTRALPAVALAYFDPAATHRRPIPVQARSWEPLILSVQFEERHPSAVPLVQASRWLLGTLRAELTLNEYAFVSDTDTDGVTFLRQRDDEDPLSDDTEDAAFARLRLRGQPRPPMGTHFDNLTVRALEDDNEQRFTIRTARRQRTNDLRRFKRRLDDYSIELQESADLPAQGYIRPDDTGDRYVLGRQYVALEAVDNRHPYLAAQLTAPSAMEFLPEGTYALGDLDKDTRELVNKILSAWPLFVLQGPPGTGKTFIARQVVRAILEIDPHARILVAAQSHHALDNLLEGVHAEIGDQDHIILRESSPRTEHKVGDISRNYILHGAIKRALARLRQAAPEDTASRGDSDAQAALARRWRDFAKKEGDLDTDIAQRLKRSASVVFSTCTGATSHALGLDAGHGFDWVIIEEAARAWITELLIPMFHGTRWLLIGDQNQLRAFQEREIRALLVRDASHEITTSATGVDVDKDWDRYLNHFDHLMRTDGRPFGFDHRGRLMTQRRMHPDIGDMVSRVFYNGELDTHPGADRPHGLSEPACFADTALVWLDTSGYGASAHDRRMARGGYVNPCERALVQFVWNQISRNLRRYDEHIPPVAVLSPYRAQVEAIKDKLGDRDIVYTVDEFQGREAEVVVVSLVRNNHGKNARAGLGFLEERERTNVLLSRARRLLVIVGSLDHCAGFGDTHWPAVAKYVRETRRFLVNPVTALGFRWPHPRGARRTRR